MFALATAETPGRDLQPLQVAQALHQIRLVAVDHQPLLHGVVGHGQGRR